MMWPSPCLSRGVPKKWGTIRVGFSLQRAYELIHQTRQALLLLSLGAIVCGTSLAIFLAMRISQADRSSGDGCPCLCQGTYDRSIQVEGNDEIGYLAHAFEQMRDLVAAPSGEPGRRETSPRGDQSPVARDATAAHSERAAGGGGQVAARVAHEVNNPLAIIKTAISIIRNHSATRQPDDRAICR